MVQQGPGRAEDWQQQLTIRFISFSSFIQVFLFTVACILCYCAETCASNVLVKQKAGRTAAIFMGICTPQHENISTLLCSYSPLNKHEHLKSDLCHWLEISSPEMLHTVGLGWCYLCWTTTQETTEWGYQRHSLSKTPHVCLGLQQIYTAFFCTTVIGLNNL